MKMLTKKIRVVDSVATGAKLRVMRTKRGISLREVARRLKVSPPYLSALERGHQPWSERRMKEFEAAIRVPAAGRK
jgi:transcriptional regulator with XRE-family HTH domain